MPPWRRDSSNAAAACWSTPAPAKSRWPRLIVRATGGAAIPLACTLAQLIAVTRRVALCIAGDTGPLHLACALGRPVVGIYGPTDPSRNGPFGTRFKVLRSPQSRRDHTRREAPEAGLLTIQPEDVLRAAEALLYPETASMMQPANPPNPISPQPNPPLRDWIARWQQHRPAHPRPAGLSDGRALSL